MTDSNSPEYPEAKSTETASQSTSGVTSSGATSSGDFVARAGAYYRRTRYVMFLMLLGFGIAFLYDGFYRWPKQNRDAIEKERAEAISKGLDPDKVVDGTHVPHPGFDVPSNRILGCLLPPLAFFELFYILRKSRGEIRFDGKTLSAPGHPPVPLENISAIDQRLWERKGIAHIDYDLGEKKGRITLDDFIYEREPIDGMYKAIVEFVAPPEPAPEGAPGFPVVNVGAEQGAGDQTARPDAERKGTED